MDLVIATFAPFGAAVLAPIVTRSKGLAHWLLAVVPAGLTVYFLSRADAVRDGDFPTAAYEWVAPLGIDFALRLDGLALLFALMICGVGALVVVYSGDYLRGHANLGRFYLLLFLFMGSMLGIVLSNNLITLFVFWELTSVSSYGLISFESHKATARSSASQALFVTGGGGLAMLAGFVLLGIEAGTLSLSGVLEAGPLTDRDLYLPILILILVGAFTKSAQVPFHFWLPNAMEAPTPVSAYLHSATMVKAGVYLLARLSPSLADSDLWFYSVTFFGGLTMLAGALFALRQTDLKRILAYSTLSILGSLVFLLGIGTEEAVLAAIVLLIAHVFYKAALFLCAGIIDHATGTRDIRDISGLARPMPVTAVCVAIAAAAMAGLPPLMGFIAKETVYDAVQHGPRLEVLAIAAAVAANILGVAVAIMLFVRPFLGRVPRPEPHPHEGGVALLLGPVLLCGLLIAGVPAPIDTRLVTPAGTAVLAQPVDVDLYLWHGLNLTLVLSALTVALGAIAYRARHHLREGRREEFARQQVGAEALYLQAIDWANRLAVLQTRILQNGNLRYYVSVTLAFTLLLVLGTAAAKATLGLPDSSVSFGLPELAVVIITLMGATMAVTTDSRLTAIISLGLVGYGIALMYALFGAPDLAITQILVETLMVLLMVFAFYRLPLFVTYSKRLTRLRDAGLALLAGATVTALLLTSLRVEYDRTLSTTLAETSKPEAHGSNVVNVILVDFRALDTLGEITVLVVAAVGIVSLLKLTSRRGAPR